MSLEEVQKIANSRIRKYDWSVEQLGYGVKLTVNDGSKYASVVITGGENIDDEIKRAVDAVDSHVYEDLDG